MTVDALAVAFVTLRLFYVGAYLGNWPTTRTVLWNVAFTANVAIFFSPWWAR